MKLLNVQDYGFDYSDLQANDKNLEKYYESQ